VTKPFWPEEHRSPSESDTPTLDALSEGLRAQIAALDGCEILCGIPCYDSAATVERVVRAVETGLRRSYPDRRSAIVILDSDSSDATVEVGLAASTAGQEDLLMIPPNAPVPARASTELAGTRGKGNALRPLFTIARAIGARACATFDSDLRSIQPSWVESVIGPVLRGGWDHVTPMYLRHKHDGTITNAIAFPLTASLYGTRIRQPIGGDFGFSGRLASFWAEQSVWESEVARFGIDVWMTTTALAEGYRVCQTRLGSKIHDAKDPAAHLGPMFRQVVATLFHLAGTYAARWERVESIAQAPAYGFPFSTGTDAVPVDVEGLLARFASGLDEQAETLASVLAPGTLQGVLEAARRREPDRFRFPIELWIDVVYDFLVASNSGAFDDRTLLNAMIGLYFARTASFVREAEQDDPDEAEARIDGFADMFLARKDRLRARWAERVPA
jgi:glucosylglycerate synthase